MKRCLLVLLFLGTTRLLPGQEILEQLDQALTLSAFHDQIRARASGTLELEYYAFDGAAPGLLDVRGNRFVNPRLTLFFDAQVGAPLYFFAQARVDRHFDPREEGAQLRLDEYALRITPWSDGRLSLQAGKFATVVARWVERHLAWDNPFISAPLIYERALPLEDHEAPALPFRGELHDEKAEYIPVIWGPSYASGISVAGRLGRFEYAAELKNASLSSRPEVWDATQRGFEHPTVSARLGFRPNAMWNLGFSASDGSYFSTSARTSFPAGRGLGDYRQDHLAQDVSFAWHHLQLWAEVHETRFDVPRLGTAETVGYFLEAKYKFLPQLFGAVRWNQQFFGDLPGTMKAWAGETDRVETALTYRFTTHVQLKAEYYFQRDDGHRDQHVFATQLTVRF